MGNLKAQPINGCGICGGATPISQQYYSKTNYTSPALIAMGYDCPIDFTCNIYVCPDGTIYISNMNWNISYYNTPQCDFLHDNLFLLDALGNFIGVNETLARDVCDNLAREVSTLIANDPNYVSVMAKCPDQSVTISYVRPTCNAYCRAIAYKITPKKFYFMILGSTAIFCSNGQGCCLTKTSYCLNDKNEMIISSITETNSPTCPTGAVPRGTCDAKTIEGLIAPPGWILGLPWLSPCLASCN